MDSIGHSSGNGGRSQSSGILNFSRKELASVIFYELRFLYGRSDMEHTPILREFLSDSLLEAINDPQIDPELKSRIQEKGDIAVIISEAESANVLGRAGDGPSSVSFQVSYEKAEQALDYYGNPEGPKYLAGKIKEFLERYVHV